MNNPLLTHTALPCFSALKPAHIEPAMDQYLAEGRNTVATLAAQDQPSWQNLIAPLEQLDEALSRAWSPVSHLNSVLSSDEHRAAYNACLPKLSEYHTEMGQNAALHQAFEKIAAADDFAQLDTAQQKLINDALRDFHLSGVDLPAEQQARYKAIAQELSQLTAKFEENLLDATQAWTLQFDNVNALAGLPDTALVMAQQLAAQRDQSGWLITLDYPSYHAVITYADDRELREKIYTAFCTRASDQGPQAKQFDNSELINQILALRHEMAQLLGFANYADYSFATKMADNVDQVCDFLRDFAQRARPQAERDLAELQQFAADECGIHALAAWDVAYVSEKLRQQRYALAQEDLRPYFAAPQVISGLFGVVQKLYGLQIAPVAAPDVWHQDVQFYQVRDENGVLRGEFYLDLYARQNKRGGAWMDVCRSRIRGDNGLEHPVAYLTCNANPPVGDTPALLTHDEVVTLFHEFGHGLHHMLTQIDYPSVGGINGVEWDAVELPSQFLENWAWQREALDDFATHYQTGGTLPAELFEKMQAAKNFQSGLFLLRQIEFALFDLQLHRDFSTTTNVQATLDAVRDEVAVLKPPAFNRFQHSFSHIFAGGYAAGYYSYLWAEVLAADAFAAFEESGIFNRVTGQRFLSCVLERGGSATAAEHFRAFRGRDAEVAALLKQRGIV